MEWIQQKTNRRNSVPINDISGFIFRKFSRGKKLEQLLFPPLSIQKFNKHCLLLYILIHLKFTVSMVMYKHISYMMDLALLDRFCYVTDGTPFISHCSRVDIQ